MDPLRANLSAASTVVPEGADAIDLNSTATSVTLVGHRLIVRTMHEAHSRVMTYALDGTPRREIELPGAGSADGFLGRPGDRATFYSFTDLITPSTVFRYDLDTGRSRVFRSPKTSFDPRAFEQRQVFYPGKDGTRIPMLLAYRKGLKLDGANPVLLYGYGGFGIPLLPEFSSARIAWLEMGGVYAIANIRGGGEYGEAWHRQAIRNHRQVAFDDFIAAAEWLIAERYTVTGEARDPRRIQWRTAGRRVFDPASGPLWRGHRRRRRDGYAALRSIRPGRRLDRGVRFAPERGRFSGDFRLFAAASRAPGHALSRHPDHHRRSRHAGDADAFVQVRRCHAGGAIGPGAGASVHREVLRSWRRPDRLAGHRAERRYLRVPGRPARHSIR